MAITGRSLKTLMSRAVDHYHNSGLRLPAIRPNRKASTVDAIGTVEMRHDDGAAPSAVIENPTEDSESTEQSPFESNSAGPTQDVSTHQPVNELSPPPSEIPSESDGDSPDEPAAENQALPEANVPASLAEILANPLPPALNVDNMISESLGNIFQKKSAKDPSLRALLDQHGDVDMRELVAELKEFANEIGASTDS